MNHKENSWESYNTLIRIYVNLDKIATKEKTAKQLKKSVLYKTNKIADIFRKLFNPRYSKEKKTIKSVHKELNNLQKNLYEKITNRYEFKKNEQKCIIENTIKNHSLDSETLKKGKQKLRTYINNPNDKNYIDNFSLNFYQSDHFNQLIQKEINSFSSTKTTQEKLENLHALFWKAIEAMVEFNKGIFLEPSITVELMVLILLKIEISPEILELEIKLSKEENGGNKGKTLAILEAALIFISKIARDLIL